MSSASRFLALAVALSGCGLKLTPPKIEPTPILLPEEAWTRVLARRVDDAGRFDYEGLKREQADLQAFLGYVAAFSPESDPERFPTAASQLAYWLNAYNAISAYAVIDSGVRPEEHRRFYSRTKMVVGGRLKTLEEIEEHVTEIKDARAYFALNGAAKGHPRLSTAAYTAGGLEEELERRTRAFMASARNVQVDRARKVVRLSEVFKRHKEVFLDRAPSLLAYVNRFRKDKVPEAYKVEFIPFDWTLNGKPPEPKAEAKPEPKKEPAL